MRVESAKPTDNGGWLHRDATPRPFVALVKPKPVETINAPAMLQRWAIQSTDNQRIIRHAEQLGVDPIALVEIGAVWAAEYNAWAFPMNNGIGQAVGIRLRNESGDKWAVKGSKSGIFTPATLPPAPRIWIVEGVTDTAAALTIGLYAIGRPSCMGSESDIVTTLGRLRCKEAVIIADEDEPGQRGALRLQGALKVISKIWTPPAKDIREAVRRGLNASDIEDAIKDIQWTLPRSLSEN